MTTIGVYTPVLNEAQHAERWAASTECADYRLWLDTGSTDGTIDAAHEHGIRTKSALIQPFRFDDARNIAMSLVPANIDIVIQLDADEVFVEDDWRKYIDQEPDHRRWSYWLTNDGNASWTRVKRSNCHRRDGFRWVSPIHEVIVGDAPTCDLDGLVIEHRPDRHKSRKYVLPMLERFSGQDPTDARLLFYLGREYEMTGDWNAAREVLNRYLASPNSWPGERSEAYLLLARMDTRPERWIWKAVGEAPDRREPFVELAKRALRAGRKAEAREYLALANLRNDPSIYTTHADAWGTAFDALRKRAGLDV